jgi:acyl carrier protein
MTTEKVLRDLIEQQIGLDAQEISSKESLEDAGFDSLDVVEFVIAVEEHFNMSIPDEDCEDLETLQQWVAYVDSKKPEQSRSVGVEMEP